MSIGRKIRIVLDDLKSVGNIGIHVDIILKNVIIFDVKPSK